MVDDLTPDDIERPGFTVREEGYDRDEVDVFLKDVAQRLRKIQAPSDKPFSEMGRQIGEILEMARATAERLRTEAETDARKTIQDARVHSQKLLNEAERTNRDLQRQVEDARIRAETDVENFREQTAHAKRLAEAELEVLRQQGHREAKRMTDEAKKQAVEVRARAEAAATDKMEEAQRYVRKLQQAEAVLLQRIETAKAQAAAAERDAEARIEAARKKAPAPAATRENGVAREAAAVKETMAPRRVVRIEDKP